jgi:hypothetical protein
MRRVPREHRGKSHQGVVLWRVNGWDLLQRGKMHLNFNFD